MPTHTSASHDLVVKDLVCKARFNVLFIEGIRNGNTTLNFDFQISVFVKKKRGPCVCACAWLGEGLSTITTIKSTSISFIVKLCQNCFAKISYARSQPSQTLGYLPSILGLE